MRLLREYDADPGRARRAAKVDLVRGIVAAYTSDPGAHHREIARVEDLYDESTGLPR